MPSKPTETPPTVIECACGAARFDVETYRRTNSSWARGGRRPHTNETVNRFWRVRCPACDETGEVLQTTMCTETETEETSGVITVTSGCVETGTENQSRSERF